MLLIFTEIVLVAVIIWWIAQSTKIVLMIWLKIGANLFEYTMIHTDDETGDFYGFTFTNDKNWDHRCLKDLKVAVAKIDEKGGNE